MVDEKKREAAKSEYRVKRAIAKLLIAIDCSKLTTCSRHVYNFIGSSRPGLFFHRNNDH